MRLIRLRNVVSCLCLLFAAGLHAQQDQHPQTTATRTAVPKLVRFSNTFQPANGLPAAQVENVTAAIYREQQGGTPIWHETQNVELDAEGKYTILLGSGQNEGLPVEVFAAGEQRWLGVQFNRPGEVEQPRVLLTSVPYALKASDAETLGGRPATDYLLAPSAATPAATAQSAEEKKKLGERAVTLTPASGSVNFVPKFVDPSGTLGNSDIFDANGFVGIGTTNSDHALMVNGVAGVVNSGVDVGFFGTGDINNLNFSRNAFFEGGIWQKADTTKYAILSQEYSDPATGKFEVWTSAPSANPISNWTRQFFVDQTGLANIQGKVGIGLSTGLSKLTVRATANFTGQGTISVTSTSSTVSGAGTTFTAQVGRGDRIQANATGEIQWVSLINSDSSITTVNPWVTMVSGSGFTILPSVIRAEDPLGNFRFILSDAGYVGINSPNPSGRLTVRGSDSSQNGLDAAIRLVNLAAGGGNGWHLRAGATGTNTPAGGFSIADEFNNYAFVINSSRNVGIGNLTPQATLDVAGDIRVGTSGTNGCLQNFSGAAIAGTCSSDLRLKKNIRPFAAVLNKVVRLQPVSYDWRAEEYPDYHFGSARATGLIAQEVERQFPEMVSQDKRGFKAVNYTELPLLLLQSIRELKTENDSLHEQLKEQEERFRQQEERIRRLESTLLSPAR